MDDTITVKDFCVVNEAVYLAHTDTDLEKNSEIADDFLEIYVVCTGQVNDTVQTDLLEEIYKCMVPKAFWLSNSNWGKTIKAFVNGKLQGELKAEHNSYKRNAIITKNKVEYYTFVQLKPEPTTGLVEKKKRFTDTIGHVNLTYQRDFNQLTEVFKNQQKKNREFYNNNEVLKCFMYETAAAVCWKIDVPGAEEKIKIVDDVVAKGENGVAVNTTRDPDNTPKIKLFWRKKVSKHEPCIKPETFTGLTERWLRIPGHVVSKDMVVDDKFKKGVLKLSIDKADLFRSQELGLPKNMPKNVPKNGGNPL